MLTYFDRLNAGLQQFMAGARKFALKYISRKEIFALTREASEVSGIPYVMDSDRSEVEEILGVSEGASKYRAKILNLNLENFIRAKAHMAK